MYKYNRIFIFIIAVLIIAYVLYTKYGEGMGTTRTVFAPVDSEVPMQLSQYDTVTVLSLAKEYLNYVVERNYDAALSMLYVLDEHNLPIVLNNEQHQKQLIAMKLFPVYGYKIDKLIFWRQTDSRLDYYLLISEPVDGKDAACVHCALRPVRYADIWYLTVADDRETKNNSEINQ